MMDLSLFLVLAHEGHRAAMEGQPTTWAQWIGSFHLVLLHFPIALINPSYL